MKNKNCTFKKKRTLLLALSAPLLCGAPWGVQAMPETEMATQVVALAEVIGLHQLNPSTVEVLFANNQRMTLQFYGENIVRLFQDNEGGIVRDPKASPEAQILVDRPWRTIGKLSLKEEGDKYQIITEKMVITIEKNGRIKAVNRKNERTVFEMIEPVAFEKQKVTVTLQEQPDEYFYGGGVQNGRFSHKGKTIAIENTNSWVDGGVASPTPFYWSTGGYGIMWHTFKKGTYDFGERGRQGNPFA